MLLSVTSGDEPYIVVRARLLPNRTLVQPSVVPVSSSRYFECAVSSRIEVHRESDTAHKRHILPHSYTISLWKMGLRCCFGFRLWGCLCCGLIVLVWILQGTREPYDLHSECEIYRMRSLTWISTAIFKSLISLDFYLPLGPVNEISKCAAVFFLLVTFQSSIPRSYSNGFFSAFVEINSFEESIETASQNWIEDSASLIPKIMLWLFNWNMQFYCTNQEPRLRFFLPGQRFRVWTDVRTPTLTESLDRSQSWTQHQPVASKFITAITYRDTQHPERKAIL